jgi:hypothetical protein
VKSTTAVDAITRLIVAEAKAFEAGKRAFCWRRACGIGVDRDSARSPRRAFALWRSDGAGWRVSSASAWVAFRQGWRAAADEVTENSNGEI